MEWACLLRGVSPRGVGRSHSGPSLGRGVSGRTFEHHMLRRWIQQKRRQACNLGSTPSRTKEKKTSLLKYIHGSSARWFCNSDMLHIDCSHRFEVPAFSEVSCYVTPFLWCLRGAILVHVLCDNYLTCLVDDLSDGGVVESEQLCQAGVAVSCC